MHNTTAPPVCADQQQHEARQTFSLDPTANNGQLLEEVIAFYHQRIKEYQPAHEFLTRRGLSHELIEHFELGFADRQLGRSIPLKRCQAGATLRKRLAEIGIYRETGHGHFNGSLTVPIRNCEGEVCELYGRKIGAHLIKGTRFHSYLPDTSRPHGSARGIFNWPSIREADEIVVTDSILNALTFYSAGVPYVTCTLGAESTTVEQLLQPLTAEQLEAFQRSPAKRIVLAMARTKQGEAFEADLVGQLTTLGKPLYRVKFPLEEDVNDFALGQESPAEGFATLLRHAESIGKRPTASAAVTATTNREKTNGKLRTIERTNGKQTAIEKTKEPASKNGSAGIANASAGSARVSDPAVASTAGLPKPASDMEAKFNESDSGSARVSDPADTSTAGLPKPASDTEAELNETDIVVSGSARVSDPTDASTAGLPKPASDTEVELNETDIVVTFDDRRYQVRGLEKNNSLGRLKVNLFVSRDDLLHVDTFDLYGARARNSFIKQASNEIYIEEEAIRRDLTQLLFKLKTMQQEQVKAKQAINEPKTVQLSQRERDEALTWLRDPNLLDCILADYDRCGLVGEETNKLICYLACVSRKLPQPLAVMIQSSSAAGKTSLMDAALAFVPEEELVRYSAMTGQSLYYMGQKQMQHKILAIAEEEGVSQASYALKLLQSDGKLRIASAGKDSDTGRLQTQEFEVKGPVMMFLTSTSQTPDPELQNRCLTLHVNETPEQTAAIHDRQAAKYTLAGQQQLADRKAIFTLHQNAQRLLEARCVLIPWAKELTFRYDQTRMRRDYEKYLALIASITLLHQQQRETHAGTHLLATLEDIMVANRLASEALGQSLDDLLPQTRQLLVLWDDLLNVRGRETLLTQRQLRDALGWGDFQLRSHLARLVELEYALVHRTGHGNGRAYELVYDGQGRDGKRFLLGLIDTTKLIR